MVDYSGYKDLLIEKNDGVALLTMNRPEVFNATGFTLHNELSRVWLDLGQDPEVRVAVITGNGNAFSAGGDFEMIEQSIGNAEVIAGTMQEARDIVHNMINLDKPVISAINGVAVGAGWRWRCWPTFPLRRSGRGSPTVTCAWVWRRATMPPSSGRCSWAWPRPSITC